MQNILLKSLPLHIDYDAALWAMMHGRPIHRIGFNAGINIENHTFIFWNTTGLVLVEHTGQGCELLRLGERLDSVLRSDDFKFTRIDIAHDIETDARPLDFVSKRESKSQRASGYQVSDSGETCYIGSKKSDRTCKVYRYNAPHPRAHLLRIEYTYRGKQADEIQKLYIEGKTVGQLASMSGVRYRWSHPCYDLGVLQTGIRAWRPDRKQGKTLRWMLAQVAPALVKLIKEDEITLPEFNAYVERLMNDDNSNAG